LGDRFQAESVEMSAPNYAGVVLHGTGFQPGETLAIDMASGPKGGKQTVIATSEGTYAAAIFPLVKGQKSGKASVTITGESPTCMCT
jgi:hypothetical protein